MLRASSFRPLAGCGLFRASQTRRSSRSRYPSPCGVWVVSTRQVNQMKTPSFRPLAGCGLFLSRYQYRDAAPGFRPLAGCGLFPEKRTGGITMTTFPSPCGVWVVSAPPCTQIARRMCFRPLAGCGLFPFRLRGGRQTMVSVPLRGVGCFRDFAKRPTEDDRFRPLAGCGLFPKVSTGVAEGLVSVPLRGVGCFGKAAHSFWCNRKKNCQLCYFIVSYWQMFINSKLRNCKVPCEAHKTAT